MPRNYERAFTERPEVYAAWMQLNTAIKAGMDLRRYELATLAAARRLRSSYCCLAHGTVLAEQFGEPVREIALDHHMAGHRAGDHAAAGAQLGGVRVRIAGEVVRFSADRRRRIHHCPSLRWHAR